MRKINLKPANSDINFSITIFPEQGKGGYHFKKEYKRLSFARKQAQKLAQNNYSVMIRLNEFARDCFFESSAPFEKYVNGQLYKEHKDFLTANGRISYGYTTAEEELAKMRF